VPLNAPRPTFYMFAALSQLFGRELLEIGGSVERVRAYAARDAERRVTVFLVNNSADSDAYVTLEISGAAVPQACGEMWLFAPDGEALPGGSPLQERLDLKINGVGNPAPEALHSDPGAELAVGPRFTVPLAKSAMALLRFRAQ
jgi:hypothetical protein